MRDLYLKFYYYTLSFNPELDAVAWSFANDELYGLGVGYYSQIVTIGSPQNVATNTFPSVTAAFNYYNAAACADILSQINLAYDPSGLTTLYQIAAVDPVVVWQTKSQADALAVKVDKVSGKGLSTEDFTTGEKIKLGTVATGATNTAAPVSADWNATSGLALILNKPTIPSATRTPSVITPSLVGTGATGTQVSSTKDSTVRLTVSTSATATIAGAATSSVALKICATNSSTEANWTTVATSETTQSYSLAVALQGVTGAKGQLIADLQAGWYYKLVNSGSGTHSEAALTGQQTIYG